MTLNHENILRITRFMVPYRIAQIFFMQALVASVITGCAFLQPSPPIPSISSVSPTEVDWNSAPITLKISGKGFSDASRVRIFHPLYKDFQRDVGPTEITSTELTIIIDEGWVKALSKIQGTGKKPYPRGVGSEETQASALLDETRSFRLSVVNGPKAISNPKLIRFKHGSARIQGLSTAGIYRQGPVQVRAGTTTNMAIRAKRETMKGEIPLRVEAFQQSPKGRTLVPGISGSGLIPEYDINGDIEIEVADTVSPGDYELEVTMLECLSCPVYVADFIVNENSELTCPSCGPLFAPTGMEIIDANFFTGFIQFRWIDNSVSENGFRIESRTANNPWSIAAQVGASPGAGQVMEWGGHLVSPLWRCYRVVAWNSYGELASSPYCDGPGAPIAPTWLRILDTSGQYVTLGYTDNSSTENYYKTWKAYCLDCPFRWWGGSHSGNSNGTGPVERTIGPLWADRDYCFKIEAVNDRGSSWSNIVCGRTGYVPPPPTAPGQLSLRDKTETSFSLRWRDYAHNEDGFKIQRRPYEGDRENIHTLAAKEGTGWMDWTNTGLAPNTTYCYRIKAFNDYGANFSGEKCGTTMAGVPDYPDLMFSRMWIDEPTEPNHSFNLFYEVCNFGGAVSERFSDKIFKDGDYGNPISITHGEPVPAFGCYIESSPYPDGLPEGCYVWELAIDAEGDVQEIDELNNFSPIQGACFF